MKKACNLIDLYPLFLTIKLYIYIYIYIYIAGGKTSSPTQMERDSFEKKDPIQLI